MTNRNDEGYDWASAAFSVAACQSSDLNDLARAASLDPTSGDLSNIDFSGLDIRNQDLSGWDLSFANFENALVAGTEFKEAMVDAASLTKAQDWQKARLPIDVRGNAEFHVACNTEVNDLELSPLVQDKLQSHDMSNVRSIVNKSIAELSERLDQFEIELVASSLNKLNFVVEEYTPEERDTLVPLSGDSLYRKFVYRVGGKGSYSIAYSVIGEKRTEFDDLTDDKD